MKVSDASYVGRRSLSGVDAGLAPGCRAARLIDHDCGFALRHCSMNSPDRLNVLQGAGFEPVRRRHVVYVEGYDPIGPEGYFGLFRGTCDRFQRLWPIAAAVTPLEFDSEDFARWAVELRGGAWQAATRFDFLRLESFIRSDMARPTVSLVLRGAPLVPGRSFERRTISNFSGVMAFRFASVVLSIVAACLGGSRSRDWTCACGRGDEFLFPQPVPLSWRCRTIRFQCLPFGQLPSDRASFRSAVAGWCFAAFARGRPTWLDHAIDVGARRIVAAARANEADELVVVGHSIGLRLACAIMARALELDPDLGRSGPRLVLLTLGSVMPAVALHPAAQRMRPSSGGLRSRRR